MKQCSIAFLNNGFLLSCFTFKISLFEQPYKNKPLHADTQYSSNSITKTDYVVKKKKKKRKKEEAHVAK